RAAKRAQRRLLRGRFTRALRLAHVAKDDSAVTDDRRISHVDGINSNAVSPRQHGEFATRAAQKFEEVFVLVDRYCEIRSSGEVQRLPLGCDGFRSLECVPRVLDEKAGNGSKFGLRSHVIQNAAAASGISLIPFTWRRSSALLEGHAPMILPARTFPTPGICWNDSRLAILTPSFAP